MKRATSKKNVVKNMSDIRMLVGSTGVEWDVTPLKGMFSTEEIKKAFATVYAYAVMYEDKYAKHLAYLKENYGNSECFADEIAYAKYNQKLAGALCVSLYVLEGTVKRFIQEQKLTIEQ